MKNNKIEWLSLASLLIAALSIHYFVPQDMWINAAMLFACAKIQLLCVFLHGKKTGNKWSVYWFWVALFTIAGCVSTYYGFF